MMVTIWYIPHPTTRINPAIRCRLIITRINYISHHISAIIIYIIIIIVLIFITVVTNFTSISNLFSATNTAVVCIVLNLTRFTPIMIIVYAFTTITTDVIVTISTAMIIKSITFITRYKHIAITTL